ncbi:MAG: CsiV family protein [Gammaproteobacteria bacterium]|nr:CsiV family protein [Gammaproteobacteria bacterium]
MTRSHLTQRLLAIPLLLGSLMLAQSSTAAEAAAAPERWFQIEMTVFAHENSDLEQELWSPEKLSLGFPERLQRLHSLSDFLQLTDWTVLNPDQVTADTALTAAANVAATPSLQSELPGQLSGTQPVPVPAVVGPLPFAPAESFRMPDFAREAFLILPPDAHRFGATNRALNQSAQYRILSHSAWRQPMTRRNAAVAIGIVGGRLFNEHRELEGNVTFYFNNAGDRVVFNGNLWLGSYGIQDDSTEEWALPVLPGTLVETDTATDELQTEYFVNRIVQLREIRELREQELHYLDHPAFGVLVQIIPYTPPPPIVLETAVEAPVTPALP